MDLREVGYDNRDWINLAQDRDRWRAYKGCGVNNSEGAAVTLNGVTVEIRRRADSPSQESRSELHTAIYYENKTLSRVKYNKHNCRGYKRRWEDNIKMNFRNVVYDGRDWINLAQDRDRWRTYVRAAMNLRVP
ncbi:hypothetical protein ANN_06092 [Periplaneta americana]|uniref:Uncharacterized protein n=1 Tax=Periplaneta americana TaxID=6978 RepID=A0ABQ8TF21_PERAM|nr:hypothetical protein ANN_06092 [Periplaneta americana]